VGKACKVKGDCLTDFCSAGSLCVAPGCSDTLKNGSETDVDCGGPSCGPCPDYAACLVANDCVSKNCAGGAGCGSIDVGS
jgi:hypothetical protein